jgi:hypothetical protein
MDRKMLEKGMWQATVDTFSACEEKAKTKIFHAAARSYWPALDEILLSLHPHDELQNVEEFVRKWIKDVLTRAWGGIENPEEVFNEEAVGDFFLRMVAPFGQDDPYSCIPGVLVEGIGIPPADWPFIREVVSELLVKWKGGSSMEPSKKRRKIQDTFSAFGNASKAAGKARPNVEKAIFTPSRKGPSSRTPAGGEGKGRGSVAMATCEAGRGHPDCTSGEDCIGAPMSRLVQHMVSENQGGDIYCEPCWCTFVRRNPRLNGIFLSD